MIDFEYQDKDFSLMTVSDKELFDSLKKDIVGTIRTMKGFDKIKEDDVQLDVGVENRRLAYGKDKNLYPNIVMSLLVKTAPFNINEIDLFLDPFTIKLALHQYDPKMVESEELTKAFVKFMTERFPDSAYGEKRKKYFENAEMMERVASKMMFF